LRQNLPCHPSEQTGFYRLLGDEQRIMQQFAAKFNEKFNAAVEGLDLPAAPLQAVRWFYVLDAFGKGGYKYARTNDTISGYTAAAARKLYGIDPQSGGRGNEGSGRRGSPLASRRPGVNKEKINQEALKYGTPVRETTEDVRAVDGTAIEGKAVSHRPSADQPGTPDSRQAATPPGRTALQQDDSVALMGFDSIADMIRANENHSPLLYLYMSQIDPGKNAG
jgi:hypothetical protein